MKNSKTWAGGKVGFTLIELLVVIAIIAILAALLIPVMGRVKQNMAIRRAEAELARVQTAIEAYKNKRGHYPPDNPANFARNQLYFELSGCLQTNIGGIPYFMTVDGSAKIQEASVATTFGQGGIVNVSSGTGGDDASTAHRLITELKPAQYATFTNGAVIVRYLGVKIDGPSAYMVNDLNPFRYNSSNPTNNPNTFDLWVDIVFGKKTNRVNNWRSTPIINP